MGRVAFVAVVAVAAGPLLARAHPICVYDARNPILNYESPVGFCDTTNEDGFCCDEAEELDALSRYEAADVTGDCADYHQQVWRDI